jgi:hypothetical protein
MIKKYAYFFTVIMWMTFPAYAGMGGIPWVFRLYDFKYDCVDFKDGLTEKISDLKWNIKQIIDRRRGPQLSYEKKSSILLPFIAPCCDPILTGYPTILENKVALGSSNRDPYLTGTNKEDFRFHHGTTLKELKKSLGYSYSPLSTLGGVSIVGKIMNFNIPSPNLNESVEDFNNKRLKKILDLKKRYPGFDSTEVTTFAGEGSQSKAYFVHPPVPPRGELKLMYPRVKVEESRRRAWVSDNAEEVIKIRKRSPWGKGISEAAQQMRRDLVTEEIFEQCANRFKVGEGKKIRPLIQVVKYENRKNKFEVSQGILRQKAVRGLTAYDLANLVSAAAEGDKSALRQLQVNGFKDPSEAHKIIQQLQAFYHETHNDVVNLMNKNGISLLAGRTLADSPIRVGLSTVGFDYNNGVNVIWDPRGHIFKAIDF